MPKELSQTVSNALRLMECFSEAEELGITELAAEIGVGKTVAARLVGTLAEYGYLSQNPSTRRYRLGHKLAYWGSLAQERNEIVRAVEPYLQAMGQEFQVTSHMAVLKNYNTLILCKVAKGPVVFMSSREGATLPTHACATGKCLLAYSGERTVQTFLRLRPMEGLTEHTIIEEKEFWAEMERIRTRGYAIDNEESNEGLTCFAVPLLDGGKRIYAAISLSGQTVFMRKNQQAILDCLFKTQASLCNER